MKKRKPSNSLEFKGFFGAGNRNRTRNLLITNQLLCQLSYAGMYAFFAAATKLRPF